MAKLKVGATAEVRRFEEAIDWFRSRRVVSDSERKALDKYAANRAFWVADLAHLDMVSTVYAEIDAALTSGMSRQRLSERIHELLEPYGFSGHRCETIARTNLQHAHAAGRWRQLSDPMTLALRPYWQFDAIDDRRTSDECNARDQVTLRADDPWWRTNHPPLHHRCRSQVRALDPDEYEDDVPGDKRRAPDNAPEPADGFGVEPEIDGLPEPWAPKPVEPAKSKTKPAKPKPTKAKKPAKPTKPAKNLRQKPAEARRIHEERMAESEATYPGGKTASKVAPEHTAAHWYDTYRAKFPEATARAMARGRATFEAGLDTPCESLAADLERVWQACGMLSNRGHRGQYARKLLQSLRDAGKQTLRSERRVKGFLPLSPTEPDGWALLGAHARRINSRTGPLELTNVTEPLRSRAEMAARTWRAIADRSVPSPLESGSGWSVTHDDFAGLNDRSYCDCVSRRIRLRKAPNDLDEMIRFMGVVMHESGHAVECDSPAHLAASNGIWSVRTAGKPLRKLRDMIPGVNYGDHEVAHADTGFIHPYVAKDYGGVATEVFSMGLERALDPGDFLGNDQEHALLTFGMLQSDDEP